MAEIDELFGNEKQTTIEPYSKDEWIKQRNGFLTVAGGIIITFAKEILDLIVG